MNRAILLAVACCALLVAQQPPKTNWSVQEVTAGTLQAIQTGMRTLTPGPGNTVLSVKALIRSSAPENLLIRTGEVFLQTTQGAKADLAGVGIPGKTGACSYELAKGLVSGFVGVSDDSGNGFDLGRKVETEPLGIKLKHNPARLCLAFIVPNTAPGGTLNLEGATAPVKLP